MDGQLACFQARGVEEVIDANAQLVTALPGDAQIFQLSAVQAASESVDHDRNEFSRGGKGRLQFV